MNTEDIERFSRQLLLPEVGKAGQERLLAAAVRLELGHDPASEHMALAYLTAAGVGRLVVETIGEDRITAAEAGVGFLFAPEDVGGDRVRVLRARLQALWPKVELDTNPQGDEIDIPAFPDACPTLHEGMWRGCGAALDVLSRMLRAS